MTVYKSNDDIPSRMSIPLPFVIMRENTTEERFAEYHKKDNLHGWLFCALVVIGQLFVLGLLLSLGNSILDVIWFWLLLIVIFAVISMIDKYQYKKQLKVIKIYQKPPLLLPSLIRACVCTMCLVKSLWLYRLIR
ncbi:hypothetical protein [Moraxella caprae]|nr:hypothetical protein [Moraxella caprae]